VSDEKKSPAERVLDELKDPWDWTAAFLGGAAGAAATIFLHGADLGHSIPTGALGAIGARRAAVASLSRRYLRRKAEALLEILEKDDGTRDLFVALTDYFTKWENGILSSETLEKQVAWISEQDTKRKVEAAKL
jgi:hypothetical protein